MSLARFEQSYLSQLALGGIALSLLSLGAVPSPAAVTAHPDLTGLPGSNVLQQLVNGAEAWALAIALLGAFIGAALWAVASHTQNHHYAARGRMAALISGASALVVGAAPGLVNFFQHLGTTAK
jgi:Family of unknown function (DUF6112)